MDMVKSRRDKKGAKQFDELICVELIAPNTAPARQTGTAGVTGHHVYLIALCRGPAAADNACLVFCQAFWDEPPIQPLAFRIVFPTFQLDTVANVSTDSSNFFFPATKSQF